MAEAFEGPVHLLSTADGDVPVDFAAHEQRGGSDVVHAIEGEDFFSQSLVVPRAAECGFLILLVMIVAVKTAEESAP